MSVRSRQYFIGQVKRAPRRGDTYHYASVEPLVESDPAGTRWLGLVREEKARFPKRGWVHWHEAPLGLQSGTWWQFAIAEHPAAERGDRPEQFQLEDAQEPIEVVDLREWSDDAALRSAITGDGIQLTPPPAARRVLFRLASGICVGPLLLKTGAHPGLWALDAPEANRDAARMPAWRLAETEINAVPLDGGRWFVAPPLDLGHSVGIQNWTSDVQVARSVLARLRRMDRDVVKAIGVTDNLFREYLDRVERGSMGSVDPAVERARADRLRGVRDAIQRDATLLAEAAETLLGTEAVRAEVDRQVQARVTDEVGARRSDIEALLAGATEELGRAQADLDATRAELASAEAALNEKLHELEATVASFDQEVTARLEEIARKPEKAFAEAVVLRAVLAAGLSGSSGDSMSSPHASTSEPTPGRGSSPSSAPRAPWVGDSASVLEDEAAVRGALAAHASTGTLALHAMIGLHATFLAGVTPVVVGSRGYDLLRAYASAVAGGRLLWIPIASSTMEPGDLLGRFDISAKRIMPAASGLLDVVRDATATGRLHLVVLEGFNRAPSEAYLAPILEAMQSSRVGDMARVIPLASPGVVAVDDPYRDLARLAWPLSVLIACLPTEGSATLPIPASVWGGLALLDADDRERSRTAALSLAADAPSSTEISPKLWTALWTSAMAEGAARVMGESDAVSPVAHALSLTGRDAMDAARLREAVHTMGLPEPDARGIAIASTLVTRTVADEPKVDEALRLAGIAAPGWRTAWTEARRLRG